LRRVQWGASAGRQRDERPTAAIAREEPVSLPAGQVRNSKESGTSLPCAPRNRNTSAFDQNWASSGPEWRAENPGV
jgi:hypothetical protein